MHNEQHHDDEILLNEQPCVVGELLLAELAIGDITEESRAQLATHAKTCAACRWVIAQMEELEQRFAPDILAPTSASEPAPSDGVMPVPPSEFPPIAWRTPRWISSGFSKLGSVARVAARHATIPVSTAVCTAAAVLLVLRPVPTDRMTPMSAESTRVEIGGGSAARSDRISRMSTSPGGSAQPSVVVEQVTPSPNAIAAQQQLESRQNEARENLEAAERQAERAKAELQRASSELARAHAMENLSRAELARVTEMNNVLQADLAAAKHQNAMLLDERGALSSALAMKDQEAKLISQSCVVAALPAVSAPVATPPAATASAPTTALAPTTGPAATGPAATGPVPTTGPAATAPPATTGPAPTAAAAPTTAAPPNVLGTGSSAGASTQPSGSAAPH
jgi:hypothetical protein